MGDLVPAWRSVAVNGLDVAVCHAAHRCFERRGKKKENNIGLLHSQRTCPLKVRFVVLPSRKKISTEKLQMERCLKYPVDFMSNLDNEFRDGRLGGSDVQKHHQVKFHSSYVAPHSLFTDL